MIAERFYAMRHGASEANLAGKVQGIEDIPLAARGEREALASAKALETAGITHIYASPLQRAYRTAEIVAQHLGLSVELLDGLRARNLGTWAFKPSSEIKAAWADHQHPFRNDPHFAPPGGESLHDSEQRLWQAVDPIIAEPAGVPLFVTHLVATGALVQRFFGQRPAFHNAEVWVLFPQQHSARLFFRPEGDLLMGNE